jgi:hypothetical protein
MQEDLNMFLPHPFWGGGCQVTVNADRSIIVRAGDSLSKYSMAIYKDFRHLDKFRRKDGSEIKGRDRERITTGEILYHPDPLPGEPPSSAPSAGNPSSAPSGSPPPGIQLPTKIRFMDPAEYALVTRVFGDTLPFRHRILITDAAGLDGRAFTIPTTLIGEVLSMSPALFFGALGVPMACSGLAVGYLASSAVNLAYLINVGRAYAHGSLATGPIASLLVHETTHVWQGKNSTFAVSYVFNSLYNQCTLGSLNAYPYSPGHDWHSYNVEQQASIVEDWYTAGEPTSGDLYPYIINNVRKGDA